MMPYDEFRKLVRDMRTSQRLYFRIHRQDELQRSKDLERRVDAELKPQRQEKGLFREDDVK